MLARLSLYIMHTWQQLFVGGRASTLQVDRAYRLRGRDGCARAADNARIQTLTVHLASLAVHRSSFDLAVTVAPLVSTQAQLANVTTAPLSMQSAAVHLSKHGSVPISGNDICTAIRLDRSRLGLRTSLLETKAPKFINIQ